MLTLMPTEVDADAETASPIATMDNQRLLRFITSLLSPCRSARQRASPKDAPALMSGSLLEPHVVCHAAGRPQMTPTDWK